MIRIELETGIEAFSLFWNARTQAHRVIISSHTKTNKYIWKKNTHSNTKRWRRVENQRIVQQTATLSHQFQATARINCVVSMKWYLMFSLNTFHRKWITTFGPVLTKPFFFCISSFLCIELVSTLSINWFGCCCFRLRFRQGEKQQQWIISRHF